MVGGGGGWCTVTEAVLGVVRTSVVQLTGWPQYPAGPPPSDVSTLQIIFRSQRDQNSQQPGDTM